MIAYPLETVITYKNVQYELDMAFDNVLRMFDLQKEELFSDIEKVEMSLDLLIKTPVKDLSLQDKADLLTLIFKGFISTGKSNKSDTKIFDFEQDAAYIYSSFMLDYGMDLVDQQGKLDWRKFIALFQGLSQRTKIREIMEIRSKPLPEPTKYNAKEIQALQEAKAYYAIKLSEAEAEASLQRGIDRLANYLERVAVKAGEK